MLVNIEHLLKTYRTKQGKLTVFSDVNFSADYNDFIAIRGKSGCGKSTLLRIIGLMDRFDSGQYFFDGNDINRIGDKSLSDIRNQNIGFVFQNFNLIPEYTVYENIELPLGYGGVKKSERRGRVLEMLNKFDLYDKVNYYPNQLSGGQQQRIAIARALINDPKIILADEPTGNLDSENTKIVMNILSELHKSGEVCIIVVTHDDLTASYADRIVLFDSLTKIGDYND